MKLKFTGRLHLCSTNKHYVLKLYFVQMLGLAKGAMESASAYIRDREAFGQKIGSFQAMQHLEAQLATEVEAASILIYNTARMKDHGINFVKEAAMAKYYSSEVCRLPQMGCLILLFCQVACMTIMNTKCCKRPVFKFLINVDVRMSLF